MESLDTTQKLRELARNLYWAWHPEVVRVFRDLDRDLWKQTNHNPVEFLSTLADKVVAEKAAELSLEMRVTHAFHQLRNYLSGDGAWGAYHASRLQFRPIAYFCAEFGLHESLPIYSGGLGILAGDHLKAASDLAIPMVGLGLYYGRGYFEQTVDVNGWQREQYPDRLSSSSLPLERVHNSQGQVLRVAVQTEGGVIWIKAWSAWVGRNRLLLLDTNVEENTDADRALTTNLYAADPRVRIRQELVLGVGAMRVLEALDIRPGVIHLNEGHCAFAVLELARQLMGRDGQPFSAMVPQTIDMTVFTTHTPVEAGHDRFDPGLIRQTLGPLRNELGISDNELLAMGRVNPNDERETFCMTVLALKMSHWRNAVSNLHARVAKGMWNRLWPNLPREEVPIHYISNGVHVKTWMAEPMSQLLAQHLGGDWEQRMDDPRTWEAIDAIDDADLWQVRQTLRGQLIDQVRELALYQARNRGESDAVCQKVEASLNPKVLTVVWARRFAEYKRPSLLLSDMNWIQQMVGGSMPVQFIIAGKAHPNDHSGKVELQRVFQATRLEPLLGKIIFLENYNIDIGRMLVQGADVWLCTSRRPLEACGTSGMKSALNGGLVFSTLDGWWAEAYDSTNGFVVGYGTEHSNWKHQDQMDADSLRWVMEKFICPIFYERDSDGIPRRWIATQKRALRGLVWRYSAQRMMMDYAFGCYLPTVGALTSSLPVDTRAQSNFMRVYPAPRSQVVQLPTSAAK